MATDVIMPKLGFSMNEASISEWLVADGDFVTEGDVIFGVESEKAVNEIESPASGRIHILKAAGGPYAVGTVVANIE